MVLLRELVLRLTLFNPLIWNVDSGTECGHTSIADDANLCGVTGILDERSVL